MAGTQLALSSNNVLSRVGTPDEREYLIEIMAAQIGIPRQDATRTDVLALLGAAAQRTLTFGWVPGIHMHVQRFETEKSREARKRNPNLEPVYTYSLVDGEKAWKDSGTRWRERGVSWKYQRKPMTPAEVKDEARLQGLSEVLPPTAYGMWSRIIILGQDDPTDDDNPLWSAGVYLGKIKAGNFWRADVIPTGISARDIAIRRADKRAMMQSQLTLLPVDDRSPEERILQLETDLRREVKNKEYISAPQAERPQIAADENGEVLWGDATPASKDFGARPHTSAILPVTFDPSEEVVAEPSEEDDAFIEGDAYTVTDEEIGARPAVIGARPTNNADGPCPVCHAPVGKMHATSCTEAGEIIEPIEEGIGARPDPSARSEKSGARPAAPAISDLDKELMAIARGEISKECKELIRKIRNADKDSVQGMSDKYFDALLMIMREKLLIETEQLSCMVLTVLLGYPVSEKKKPGMLVHGFLVRPLRDADDAIIGPIREFYHDVKMAIKQQQEQVKNG